MRCKEVLARVIFILLQEKYYKMIQEKREFQIIQFSTRNGLEGDKEPAKCVF